MKTYNQYLKRAIEYCGNQWKLAVLLDVTQSAISQCLIGDKPIPATWCKTIEAITEGEVRAVDLRPDVFHDVLIVKSHRVNKRVARKC